MQVENEFDQVADLTTLSVGLADLVAKDTLLESLRPWLDRLGLADAHFSLQGPLVGRNFSFKFSGNWQSAAQRAKKANMLSKTKRLANGRNSTRSRLSLRLCPCLLALTSPRRRKERFNSPNAWAWPSRLPTPTLRHITIHASAQLAQTKAPKSFEESEVEWVLDHIPIFSIKRDEGQRHFDDKPGLAPNHVWSV